MKDSYENVQFSHFRLSEIKDNKQTYKSDLLCFDTNDSMHKKQLINDDSVPQLANMEANVRQKLQPVRGTTFEQTKTDTISDTPVSTKCPKCGSVISKTEKVLRKSRFLHCYEVQGISISCTSSNSILYFIFDIFLTVNDYNHYFSINNAFPYMPLVTQILYFKFFLRI